jgi:hypothetical protein
MQITEVVRNSYNDRYRASYSRDDLLDSTVSIKMASDTLNRIVTAYNKHPDRNLKTDWNNPEFVKLVTAGWNSGYSEAGGVGRVAKYLESKGIPVTHDNVFEFAEDAGATKHLSNPSKKSWQSGVTSLFYEVGGPGRGGMLVAALLTGAVAFAFLRLAR